LKPLVGNTYVSNRIEYRNEYHQLNLPIYAGKNPPNNRSHIAEQLFDSIKYLQNSLTKPFYYNCLLSQYVYILDVLKSKTTA